MVKIRQAIVVEGKYDQNTLSQLVDATIFQTRGFGIMHDKALLELLRKAARTTGLIIFTDSDGAGFVIRNYLKGALPKEGVLHAYIPDIPGKEKRKRAPGKEGLLGVEGMTKEILLEALQNAGAELDGAAAQRIGAPITKLDLYAAGLSGRPDSQKKREAFLKQLRFPAHMSANAMLSALNLLYTREEFLSLFEEET